MKHVMVSYLHAKNYRKRSNGSKDIAVWEIERSDWSRAFKDISREQEFSRTCGFRRKLVNHKTLRFMPFLAKTNGWIFCQSPKTLFLPFLDPFCPFLVKFIFFEKMTSSYETCYGILPSCKKIQKTVKRFKRYSRLRNRAIDWSRAFKNISQEQEFSWTCGFRRKLVNHKTLLFRSFLA